MFYLFYRYRRKKQAEAVGEVDSSAMADLAFLLLIFFIVTSSFILPKGLNLILPSERKKPTTVKKNEVVTIEPQLDGVLLNDSLLKSEEWQQKLANLDKETIMVIAMPDDLVYRRLMDTLSDLKRNKFTRISLQDDGIQQRGNRR